MNTDEVTELALALGEARDQLRTWRGVVETRASALGWAEGQVDSYGALAEELEKKLNDAILRTFHIDPRDQSL